MSKEERKNKQIEEDSDEDDSEDDDYVPSDDKDDNQEELDDEEDDLIVNNKNDNDKIVKTNELTELTEEERKKRADQLWADLMELDKKPVKEIKSNDSVKQQNSSSNLIETKTQNSSSNSIETKTQNSSSNNLLSTNKPIITKVCDEKVKEDSKLSTSAKPNSLKRSGLGINNLVANLGKKSKLSTLNKTKQDWDLFKKEEGIEDDLKRAKKDKNSFVERTAFLQRTDLRLFESEKSIRDKNRTRNQF